MSHFVAVVLVPPKDKNILKTVERLMKPYDEAIEVKEYDDKCWCIGKKAEHHAFDIANKKKDIKVLRSEYDALPETQRPAWSEFISEWESDMNKAIGKHPLRGKPDPRCDSCKGTGTMKSTYNPKSKWDGWRVGGRWDGEILGDSVQSSNGFNFSGNHESLEHNMAKVKKIHKDFKAFAVVTPDGEWHQEAKMGWFGITSGENTNWEADYKKIMAKYGDHWAVSVDCHI